MPSIPITGNNNKGVGENHFIANSRSGLWSRSAIAEAPQKSNRDKNNPSIAKSLEIFLITSFDSGKLTLGMK